MSETDGRIEELEARLEALERDPIAVPRRARADEELRRVEEERVVVAEGLERLGERLSALERDELPVARRQAEEAGVRLREVEDERNGAQDRLRRLHDEAGLLRTSTLRERNKLASLDESTRALTAGKPVGGLRVIGREDVGT